MTHGLQAVDEHPILATLPKDLAIFAYSYLKSTLGLPNPADRSGRPDPSELNGALCRHLVPDNRGRHISTFGCLELESETCRGVQRIRCFPFSFDTFRDNTQRPYVAVVPPTRYTRIAFRDFNLADADHRAKMWIARVELLFTCTFKDRHGDDGEYDLALLSFLYDFKCASAAGPMQRSAAARQLYVPTQPWTLVLPVNHILGKVPLMKLYLEGSSAPTIPHSFAGQRQRHFQYGSADKAGTKGVGSGSQLFEVNVHLWQFGRPQPRNETVDQRMQHVKACEIARANKRAATREKNRELKKARANLSSLASS